jgi:hypothetical protein
VFSEWINRKYDEWQLGRTRKESTIAKFAAEFSASQSIMSRWMRPGSKPPKSPKYLNALEKRYGDEFLAILGIEKSEKDEISLDQVPDDLRVRLERAIAELVANRSLNKIEVNSPEDVALAKVIFEKYGFSVKTSVNENSG